MTGTGRIRLGALALLASLATGCMTAARVFLDLPEETGRKKEEVVRPELSMEMLDSIIRALQEGPVLPPPPIEDVTDPDSLLALLPRDRAGAVDWVAAMDDGLIRPRRARPGVEPDSAAVFPFDIYLGGEDQGPEALFPHSTHQSWLSCQSCHPALYGKRNAAPSPDQVHGEASCGYCHNGLAFSVASCERCHASATDLPPGRLEATLGGTYRMTRAGGDFPENSDGSRYGRAAMSYPPAVFPHGAHRVRFQCRACHEKPFAMQGGATLLSADEAHTNDGCGYCHNGGVAFDTGGDTCFRCHVPEGQASPEE